MGNRQLNAMLNRNKQEVENKGKKIKSPFDFSKFSFIFCHYAIAIVIVLVFFFYCNAASIVMAFQRLEKGKTVWTLYNFEWFFSQFGSKGSQMTEAFLNTFMWWGISLLNTIVGVFTAFFIYKKISGYKLFRVLFRLPGMLSPVVLAFIISRMFSAQGFIATAVQNMFGLEQAPDLLYDERFARAALIIKGIPFAIAGNMLIWVGTMSRIPDGVIESAKLDGANWFVEMFRIVLPMILPVVGITLCGTISGLFSANGGEFLYTKGQYGTMTLNTWLFLQLNGTSTSSNTHNQAAAVGWITTLVITPLILWVRGIMNKIGSVEY